MSNFYLFNEKVEKKTGIRVLAQNFVDRGAHPKNFESGPFKNELTEVYNERKILEIKTFKKVPKNLSSMTTKQLDEIYLQLSRELKQ
tara:strand:+ start:456 stop:716 length:261 start_codon:yes stop_codon:yes gene_type:complete